MREIKGVIGPINDTGTGGARLLELLLFLSKYLFAGDVSHRAYIGHWHRLILKPSQDIMMTGSLVAFVFSIV